MSNLQAEGIDISGFGFSLKAGAISSDANFKTFMSEFVKVQEDYGMTSFLDIDDDTTAAAGINLFYEKKGLFGLDKKHFFGASAEYLFYPKSQYERGFYESEFIDSYPYLPGTEGYAYYQTDMALKSEAYAIPINIYYKYALSKKFKVSASIGLTFLHNEFTISGKVIDSYTDSGDPSNDFFYEDSVTFSNSQNIVMPNIGTGAEFAISRYLGLFVDIDWQLNGKAEWVPIGSDRKIERDFSGFTFNLGVKIYPFAFTEK